VARGIGLVNQGISPYLMPCYASLGDGWDRKTYPADSLLRDAAEHSSGEAPDNLTYDRTAADSWSPSGRSAKACSASTAKQAFALESPSVESTYC
jgi:hypothetical protein